MHMHMHMHMHMSMSVCMHTMCMHMHMRSCACESSEAESRRFLRSMKSRLATAFSCARQWCSSLTLLLCSTPPTLTKLAMPHTLTKPAESPEKSSLLEASVASATTASPGAWPACCSHTHSP